MTVCCISQLQDLAWIFLGTAIIFQFMIWCSETQGAWSDVLRHRPGERKGSLFWRMEKQKRELLIFWDLPCWLTLWKWNNPTKSEKGLIHYAKSNPIVCGYFTKVLIPRCLKHCIQMSMRQTVKVSFILLVGMWDMLPGFFLEMHWRLWRPGTSVVWWQCPPLPTTLCCRASVFIHNSQK